MLRALRDDHTLRRRLPLAGAESSGGRGQNQTSEVVKPLVEAALSSGGVDDGRYLQLERQLNTITSNMYEKREHSERLQTFDSEDRTSNSESSCGKFRSSSTTCRGRSKTKLRHDWSSAERA